ncbi:MAG: TIGR03016 family PEP-CTERM system-associated outer membrane protein [Kordiimonadales bacterium]|nr:MAG: TIGR03016 family PEP-CTERM system-associated outer membrane protein [Kordiimonadales bacterium]
MVAIKNSPLIMGMAGAKGCCVAYFRPKKFSKLCLMFCLYLFAANTALASDHWFFDPRTEARLSLTDNALLTESGRVSDAVLNLSPGLNVRYEGKRITAAADYALDYFYFLSDNTTDTRQNLFGTLDAEVIEDHLTIVARASLREQFLDQRGSISSNFANQSDNRRLLQNYTGTAILKGGVRDFADWRITYRYGISRTPADNLEDETLTVNFSDTNSQEISAALGSGDRFNSFSWRIFANSSKVTRSLTVSDEVDVNDFWTERAGAELKYKFNRFFQLIGEVGVSDNGFQSAELSEDGFTWQAGFRWTPGRKLDITATAGKDGRRETYSAQVLYLLTSRLDFNGTYQDVLTANTIVTNDSLQSFNFDEDNGITNGQRLPIDETNPIFTFSDTDFRRRTTRGTLTLRQKRTQFFLSGNYELRTFDDASGTAQSWGVSSGFERRITTRSQISGDISFRRSRFEGETRIDNNIRASLDWTVTLSRYFKAAIGFSHSERQSNEPGADLEENSMTFYLRGTF